jgi:Na+-transporting NADH:ubiquinone oxidoreductase subunit B
MADKSSEETASLPRLSPRRFYLYQKPMFQVVLATLPAVAGAVYFFGWRALAVVLISVAAGSLTEWLFCRSRGEKVSSAVLVTAVLYALILPPRVPYLVVLVGIVVAIVFGKEVFGGFGRNVFNPAMVGRCFIYVCFPQQMTKGWLAAMEGAPAGLAAWTGDALTGATPLAAHKAEQVAEPLWKLIVGNVGGCLGETSAVLILLGAAYLLIRKTASWRIIASCIAGAVAVSALFRYLGAETMPDPLFTVLGGGLLFGAVFMATDPISAAQTNAGRYIYGFLIGALTVIIRGFSSFAGGFMFALLLMNIFNPLIDHLVREARKTRKGAARQPAAQGGEAA